MTFGQILGVEKTMTLAENSLPVAGRSVTVSSSDSKTGNISPAELENTYRYDPITFNSINKSVQTIMSAGYMLEAKSDKVKKWYRDFFSKIGLVGDQITTPELLYTIYQNEFIYGQHFIEIVYNKNETSIVDLKTLDPKEMDYARNSSQNIVLDEFGKIVGYTQTLPYSVDTEGKGDQVPESVTLNAQQIFLLPKRIAHFKLYTYGDKFNAVGLIEPAYKSIVRRQNIEEAQANSIYARGTYPVIDYIGDENHFPTPNMIKAATEKLKLLQHNRYFAVPYWHNIKPLEVKQSEVVDNTLKYLRENASASLGLPIALATGSGEATNRATLATQQKFLEYSLRDTVHRTMAQFREQIFKKITVLEKFDETPKIVWGDIDVEDKDDKAKRLVAYANNKVGILNPKDARAYAMGSEKLKLFDEFSQDLNKKEKKVELSNKDNLSKELNDTKIKLNKLLENDKEMKERIKKLEKNDGANIYKNLSLSPEEILKLIE